LSGVRFYATRVLFLLVLTVGIRRVRLRLSRVGYARYRVGTAVSGLCTSLDFLPSSEEAKRGKVKLRTLALGLEKPH